MLVLKTGILLIFISIVFLRNRKYALGFLFVLLIMGFQSNIQGDYINYQDNFNHLTTPETAASEPFLYFLNRIFHPLGWHFFVFFMASIQTLILYLVTQKYASRSYNFLSSIVFFFTFGMMCEQMNTMRQGYAAEIALIPFLLDRKEKKHIWIYYLIPFVIAYLTHNSAIIMLLPLALLYLLKDQDDDVTLEPKKEWLWPAINAGLVFLIYVNRTYVFNGFFQQLYSLAMENDMRLGHYLVERTAEDLDEFSFLIALYDAITVFFSTWLYQRQRGPKSVFPIITIAGCIIDVTLFGMGTMPRIGYYFVVASIVTLPNICEQIESRFGKIPAWMFVVFCIGYAVKTSLPSMTENGWCQYGDYQFIFMQ